MGDPVECPDCHKELENWARRAAHRRWSHGVVSKEKAARGETATEHRCYEKGCPGCDRTFALPAHLGRHMAAHRDEKDACDLCGKIVKQGGLALHKTARTARSAAHASSTASRRPTNRIGHRLCHAAGRSGTSGPSSASPTGGRTGHTRQLWITPPPRLWPGYSRCFSPSTRHYPPGSR
jgi:hypothetical protein